MGLFFCRNRGFENFEHVCDHVNTKKAVRITVHKHALGNPQVSWPCGFWELNPQFAFFVDLRIADFPTKVKNGCGFAVHSSFRIFCEFVDCDFKSRLIAKDRQHSSGERNTKCTCLLFAPISDL